MREQTEVRTTQRRRQTSARDRSLRAVVLLTSSSAAGAGAAAASSSDPDPLSLSDFAALRLLSLAGLAAAGAAAPFLLATFFCTSEPESLSLEDMLCVCVCVCGSVEWSGDSEVEVASGWLGDEFVSSEARATARGKQQKTATQKQKCVT